MPDVCAQNDDLDSYFEDYFMDDSAEEWNEAPQKTTAGVETIPDVAVQDAVSVVSSVVDMPIAELQDTSTRIDFSDTYLAVRDPENDEDLLDDGMWDFTSLDGIVKELNEDSFFVHAWNFFIGEAAEETVGDDTLQNDRQMHRKTLKRCIAEATENHLPIDIARTKVEMYRRRIRKATRDMFTQYQASDSQRKYVPGRDQNSRSEDQTEQAETVKVTRQAPLYKGGTLWNKVREEKANLKTAIAEYNKIFADLALEVSTAYFNLARARTMLAYRESLLEKAQQALAMSQEKFNANLISEIEHLNVQSQQSQISHNLEQAKEDIELAMLELQKAMSIDIDKPVNVYGLDDFFTAIERAITDVSEEPQKDANGDDEKKIEEFLASAYENRPEFVIGQSKVDAKKYALKIEHGKWLPQVTLEQDIGENRAVQTLYKDLKDGRWESEYRMGLQCAWNVLGNTMRYQYENKQDAPTTTSYNGGGKGNWIVTNTFAIGLMDDLEQFATTKEAEIKAKEALLEFEMSEKDMVSEVKESYYNYNRAKLQMKTTIKKINYRTKLVTLAKHRSDINEIQLSEYLQAEIDYVEEKATLYQTMVDYMLAEASLNKATGTADFSRIGQIVIAQ